MNKILNIQVNNIQLVVFRVLFGLVLAAEGFGAILTGWVKEVYVDTNFNFTFFGFEWLEIFHGTPMYIVFVGLGLAGLCISLGFYYRLSTLVYALLWSITYFGQKVEYNNHYYLILLLAYVSVLLPAHKRFSLDVKLGRVKESGSASFYLVYFYVFQFAIVYTFGALNKIYPDWLDGTFIANSFAKKSFFGFQSVKSFFTQHVVVLSISYLAIIYDALIILALIWTKTRKLAVISSFAFHLFNSVVYQVGVFPYLSLALLVFFIKPTILEKKLGKVESVSSNSISKLLPAFFLVYFAFQLILPIRHHFINGNVFYTEEGHRMSWRMMLRSKRSNVLFFIEEQGKRSYYPISHLVSRSQEKLIANSPDVTYQMAQKISEKCLSEGRTVKVFALVNTSLNGRKNKRLINEEVDLASVKRNYFTHNEWVLSYEFD